MEGTLKVLLWWLLFGASHMLISSTPVRRRVVARIGQGPYMMAYSVLALALFIPLVGAYMGHRHEGPLLWAVPVGDVLRWLLYAGNTLGFVMLACGFVTPSPVIVGMPYTRPRGIHFITRHGIFMGLSLWALMHLVVNGFLSDLVFFGGFIVLTLAGCWHQDRRQLASGDPKFAEFHRATPFIPFTGNQTLRGLKELSWLGVVTGAGIAILLRAYHAELFSG